MKKLTKIVATISDLNCQPEFLRELFDAGMNVVRLNTAHQTHDDTLKVIENVRKVSDKIALLLDTKGPEIRTTKSDEKIFVKGGDKICMKGDPEGISTSEMIYVSYPDFVKDVHDGSSILIDDGDLELEVLKHIDDKLLCEVKNQGYIKGRKSVNIPSAHLSLPALSEKDKGYIHFAAEHDLDFIAHSFVRNKQDVLAVQRILDEHNSNIKIIAKIENQQGIDNIDEILDVAHGVMIARGDLAIEVPRERIPIIQKNIIRKSMARRKISITATQMLHSMIENPRPTRAEVTDIATAIYDGTDAVMLSGETAYGKYPLESLRVMSSVAMEVEQNKGLYAEDVPIAILASEISGWLCQSAVKAATQLKAQAIVADTTSGRTIRNLAGYRGNRPIFAMAYSKRTMRELALSYGVHVNYIEQRNSPDEFIRHGIARLIKKNYLQDHDIVVVIAGSFGRGVGASFIEIGNVKELLTRTKEE
ncbi:Pyruvate kinase [Salinivirga cyanobacteriivorans]|uniref:Pyruvate kinase n=1 Tax=Salinivirga cyanobacteriivorans TaxID=1307839 RepID=A0A0S2I2A4_9BACT|nr:pyruvate kinase [Salinivirga cyanobacteriivorans]ALO16486.1 Pyruvate kinase [Salinivirga cyanobacteriivorans]